MTIDHGPVVQGALLRSELVRLRTGSGRTQRQVAEGLDWSPSKVIRIEGGHSLATEADLDALLDHYALASDGDRYRLHGLRRRADEPGWWEEHRAAFSPDYLAYVSYETGAASIRQYQGCVIPGLLQTREYAEVLTTTTLGGSDMLDSDMVDAVVRLRLRRQSELAERENPPQQTYVLDEGVIRRHTAIHHDRSVMPAQLRHIVSRARSDERITIRVILFEAGAHAGLGGPFTLLTFDDELPEILYLDSGRDVISVITGNDRLISDYAASFEALLEEALPADASLEFIERAASEMS